MVETLIAAKAVTAGACFAILFLAERIARAAAPPSSPARLWRNGALWLVIMLIAPLITGPMTALGANNVIWTRPAWMNAGAIAIGILILDLIILDCWTYWLHRAYHRFPLLWRLHEVHHRDEFLDTTSTVRFHIGEVVLSSALRLGVIAIFALPLTTVLIYETLMLCASFFHHSNIRLPKRLEKALSYVVVTPSIHWVHHHAIRRDTDSNYATVLSLWDPLFGSRSKTRRTLDMKIGAEGVEDMTFLGLLLLPFRRRTP